MSTEKHAAQVVVVADTHHHELGTLNSFGRCGCGLIAVFSDPRERSLWGAVVDGNGMPRCGEVTRHRASHHTETEKCDLCHVDSLTRRQLCDGTSLDGLFVVVVGNRLSFCLGLRLLLGLLAVFVFFDGLQHTLGKRVIEVCRRSVRIDLKRWRDL